MYASVCRGGFYVLIYFKIDAKANTRSHGPQRGNVQTAQKLPKGAIKRKVEFRYDSKVCIAILKGLLKFTRKFFKFTRKLLKFTQKLFSFVLAKVVFF